jgi:GNAT superfamily N-acetyltransferase
MKSNDIGAMRERQVASIATMLMLPPAIRVRPWADDDFSAIQNLSQAEGWTTPIERPAEALAAWQRSWPALVACADDIVIAFCRALSDGMVTTYIAEVLVAPPWQRNGIAAALLEASQRLCPGSRLDLLTTDASRGFYDHLGYRSMVGFRQSWRRESGPRECDDEH